MSHTSRRPDYMIRPVIETFFQEVKRLNRQDHGGALQEMYRRHYRVILAQLRGRVAAQDVEDALCSVIDAMLARLDQLQQWPELRQAAYIRSVARNVAMDYLRGVMRDRRHMADMPDEDMSRLPDTVDSPEMQAVRRSELEAMQAAIRSLPPEKRDLLEMKYMQNMDDAQIAARLGIRRDNVRQRLFRVRKELRRMMEDMGYE